MIEVKKQIKESINYLTEVDTMGMEKDFIYQEKYFNSEDYNHSFEAIEGYLNDLYERTRMLQDVIEYAKTHIKNNILTISKECTDILDSIEDSVDSLKNKSYITIEVPFQESIGSYNDRSNVILPKCMVQDGALTLSHEVNRDIAIQRINRTKGLIPYKENLNELKEDKEYRVFYMLDNPVKGGLIEEIQVDFETEEEINYLKLKASNAKVIDVEYETATGVVDHIQTYKDLVREKRKAKAVRFSLHTDKYEKKTYYIDASNVKPNFLTTIQDNEYNKITGIGTAMTPAQYDEISGLKQFVEDYKSYVSQVEDWLRRRQNVVDENKKRGYSDAVPDVNFVVPPSELLEHFGYVLKNNSTLEEVKKEESDKPKEASVIETPSARNYEESIYPDSERHRYYKEDKEVYYDKAGKKQEMYLSDKDIYTKNKKQYTTHSKWKY